MDGEPSLGEVLDVLEARGAASPPGSLAAVVGEVLATPTAATMVAWYAEAMSRVQMTASVSNKARVGKAAKALLDAKANPNGIRWAIAEAARRNRIDLIETLYGDWEREQRGVDRSAPRQPVRNVVDERIRTFGSGLRS